MRADMSATETIVVPKRITNAQTVCNEKNEKGKPCWGHLKQLRTAGEPAEIHLRGDDVLSKCQTCGMLYMGPPLGHVRDPYKQHRFVEAELQALLQAAGGTLPVIKKDEQRGVYVMVETVAADHGHAAKPAPAAKAAAPAAPVAAPKAEAKAAPAAVPKPAEHKAGAQPNRQLFRRSTYVGVKDTGPVAGETFEQKVVRLKAVSVAAKQRAEEGGTSEAAPPPEVTEVLTSLAPDQEAPPPAATAPAAPASPPAHKPTGNADRTLFKRSTYCGVTDTGPVPGETFEQKIARLSKVSAAAKQRAEGG